MFACTCTCTSIARRLVTTQRLLTTSAVRLEQAVSDKGKGSTGLEWDSTNKQWIKKNASRTAQKRPGPAERARILQELKEQRLNEVTELTPSLDTKDLQAGQSDPSSNVTDTSSTSSPTTEPASNVSTSGRRYMRGQDSSSLQVQTATTLEGVPIPIRPSPPESTDCCMTGCPRCVYDIYTEDLQLHFEAMDKARKELTKKGVPQDKWPVHLRKFAQAATSTAKMKKEDGSDKPGAVKTYDSDDADGISAFDVAAQVVTDEIQDLDISLRTFLKFERELRQRRKREQAQKLALNHVSSMSSTPSSMSNPSSPLFEDRPNA